jgi:hypothetical protein
MRESKAYMCVCVCVCARAHACMCACMCVCRCARVRTGGGARAAVWGSLERGQGPVDDNLLTPGFLMADNHPTHSLTVTITTLRLSPMILVCPSDCLSDVENVAYSSLRDCGQS